MFSCFRLTNIKSNLRFNIFPVIYHCIIHMNRIPHNVCKKTYCILVKKFCRFDHYISGCFIIGPFTDRNNLTCCTVNNFPPSGNIITCIYFQHIRIKMIHQVNFQFFLCSCMEMTHNVHLLDFIRVCLSPFIIFSGCIISCVDFSTSILQFLWKFCTVTVTDRICSPLIHNLQCFFYHIQVCRNGNSAFILAHFSTSFYFICFLFSFILLYIDIL